MKKLLLIASCAMLSVSAFAQFIPPSAAFTETTYPFISSVPYPVGNTAHVSCYSLPVGWTGGGGYGTVSSWDDPSGLNGIAWQCVGPNMSITFDQGYLAMPVGASFINVGIIHNGPNPQIDVSYHLAGVGHFVDIYDWQQPVLFGGPGGVVLVNSIQLSTIPNPTRISQDTHIGYGTGIVWQDPANGINIIAANNNNFGPPFTLNGTNNHVDPDVAFTHAGALDLHIVSYDQAIGIYEYYVTWFDIIPGGIYASACPAIPPFSTCGLVNTVEDLNTVNLNIPDLHIDAPDHHGPANWSYVYTDGNNVFTRIMNQNPGLPPQIAYGGVPATINLTDGSYPNPPYLPAINTSSNYKPVVAWDQNPGNGFYVGWASNYNDPSYNPFTPTYVAIQLGEDGSIVNPLAPFNYMAVNQTVNWTSPTPAMYFSKQNDQTSDLYVVFSQFDGTNYMIQHKLVPWSSGTFKPGPTYLEDVAHNHSTDAVEMHPNPFTTSITLEVPANLSNELVTLKLTDIFGKTITLFEGNTTQVNAHLKAIAGNLATGNYIADVRIMKTGYQNTFKLVKTE
jgi:hypothetical protein